MGCDLARSEEFQELKKHFTKKVNQLDSEMQLEHGPIFSRLTERKLKLIGETMGTIDRNPNMTMYELSYLVEDRIDSEEIELANSKTFEEKEIIYHNISALECISYLVRKVRLKYRHC